MTHPSHLIANLEKELPNVTIRFWIYGFFTVICKHSALSLKGMLAATDENLVFLPNNRTSQNTLKLFSYEDIQSVSAALRGTTKLICDLQEGRFEMTFISRGDLEGMEQYLKIKCANAREIS